MTTGAPNIDVIALIGNVISIPGIWETTSQINIMAAPKSKYSKIKWYDYWFEILIWQYEVRPDQ